jgi:uncharacterized protein (DUF2336 family)
VLGQTGKVMDELSRSVARADASARDEMLTRMAELFDGVSHLLDPSGLETFDAIFVSLAPSCSTAARAGLSNKVARNKRGPRRAIRHLAFDDEIVVARPVITLSPLLLDDDQLALATVKSLDHLAALCERSTLSSGVTDIILSRADGRIRVALAANRGAVLSSRAGAILSDLAEEDDALHEALEAREPKTAASSSAASGMATPAMPGLAALDVQLAKLLLQGETDQALGLLAKALGVPAVPLAKAFAVDIHGGFLAYARAANLSWETAEAFLKRRYEVGNMPARLQRAARDFQQLTPPEARRVVALLVRHAVKTAH